MHRKAMRVNSLFSYPYLNQQKLMVLPIIVHTLSSTKLEIRAKCFLPGSKGVGGKRELAWWKGRGWGKGGRNDSNIVCTYE
jgi:hypothetical protein